MANRNIFLEMSQLKDLTPSERQVINFILNNPQKVCDMSIVELGANSYTSASTVSRVSKKLQCDGYAHFRQRVCTDISTYQEFLYKDDNKIPSSLGGTLENIIDHVIMNSTRALSEVKLLNSVEDFQNAIYWLQSSKKITLYGSGVSNLICQDAMFKGLRMGLDMKAYIYYSEMAMAARLSTPEDLAIIVSYTGQTTEMIKIAKILHLNRVKTISITSNKTNEISELSNLKLYVGTSESFYRIGGVESRISIHNILDIILTGYYNQTKNAKETSKKTFIEDTFGINWTDKK